MTAAIAIIQGKTWMDYYMESRPSAHFIAFAALVYLWLFFLCGLRIAQNRPAVYFQLLLPCSLLPLVIGICGTSITLQSYLGFIPSPHSDLVWRLAEVLSPLIAGSFLTALFLLMTLMILFFQKRHAAQKFGPFESESPSD